MLLKQCNTVFNTKIGEVEKHILDDVKYYNTDEFNKFSSKIFDEKFKKAKLATINDLKTVKQIATKNEEEMEKLSSDDSSLFIGKSYFGPKFLIILSNLQDFQNISWSYRFFYIYTI